MVSDIKQVIVVRHDLNYGTLGKKIAQASHASLAFLTNRISFWGKGPDDTHIDARLGVTEAEQAWIKGSFAKICVRVDSEAELLDVHQTALKAGLVSYLITDKGLTVFKEPTITCCGIGPDTSERLDPVTGHLRLL